MGKPKAEIGKISFLSTHQISQSQYLKNIYPKVLFISQGFNVKNSSNIDVVVVYQ